MSAELLVGLTIIAMGEAERARLLAHTAAAVPSIDGAHARTVLTTLTQMLEELHNDLDVLRERLGVHLFDGPPVQQASGGDEEAMSGFPHLSVATPLMDTTLPSGQKLGDATREEVLNAAAFFQKLGEHMAWNSRWLARVADEMGNTNSESNPEASTGMPESEVQP